jgi:hypothetical protein
MTATGSPTLWDSPPLPSDPAGVLDQLDSYVDALAKAMEAEMARIVRAAGEAYLATLTAAGDPSAMDGMEGEWSAYVDQEVGPMMATIYREAALSATIAAQAPPHISALMAPVINQQAVDYARVATNRIVGAGDQLWGRVRGEVVNTVATGGTVEDLKGTVEKVTAPR